MYQFVLLQIGIPTRISKIQFKISREPKNQNQLFHLAIHETLTSKTPKIN